MASDRSTNTCTCPPPTMTRCRVRGSVTRGPRRATVYEARLLQNLPRKSATAATEYGTPSLYGHGERRRAVGGTRPFAAWHRCGVAAYGTGNVGVGRPVNLGYERVRCQLQLRNHPAGVRAV